MPPCRRSILTNSYVDKMERVGRAYIAAFVDPILLEKADSMAERLGVNRSEFLRYAIQAFIDNEPPEE